MLAAGLGPKSPLQGSPGFECNTACIEYTASPPHRGRTHAPNGLSPTLQALKHKIDRHYRVNMVLDNLPVTVYDLLDEVRWPSEQVNRPCKVA